MMICYKIRVRYFIFLLILVLGFHVTIGALFYQQNYIPLAWLVFWVTGMLIIGVLFVLSVRAAQRKGFVDGFQNGRNGVRGKKK